MSTPFSEIYNRAMFKFSDYEFLKLTDVDKEHIMESFLKSAQSDFEKKCRIDLSLINDEDKEYELDLDNECIEILASGVAYYWVSSKLLDSDILRNKLSTKDYSYFSPANLLRELTAFKESLYKEFRNKMTEYTYYNGDISSLKA